MSQTCADFSSRYFDLMQVADGIFAAVVRDGNGAMGNAGIIDLGDQTLVFDTFQTTRAAQDLLKAAEQLTGRRPDYVVNSHWHRDHTFGNQVFSGAQVISSAMTRTALAEKGTHLLANVGPQLSSAIAQLKEAVERENDEQKRTQLRRQLADFLELEQAVPELVLTLPSVTFDGTLTIHGSRRSVSLVCHGVTHSEGDTYLLVPGEGIVFAGDIVLVQNHPWMGHGDAAAWLKTLDELAAMDLKQVVPGHGPVGTSADIGLLRDYINDAVAMVQGLVDGGASAEQVQATAIPERWAGWGTPEVFGWNLHSLYGMLIKGTTNVRP